MLGCDRYSVTLLRGRHDGVTTPRPLGPLRDMASTLGSELAPMLDADTDLHVVSAWLDDLEPARIVAA